MPSYREKEQDFEEAFNNSYDCWFPWLAEAHEDFKYFLEHPWTSQERQYLKDQGREILNFNIIRRIVKIVSGYERKNRLTLKISPSEGSDGTVASQMTGLVMPVMENRGGHHLMSDAFEFGSLVAGANLVEPYLDRRGDISYARKPYNKFLLDPNFTQRDLSDCGNIIIFEEGMLTSDVQSIMPGKESIIKQYAKYQGDNARLPFSAYRGRDKQSGKRCNYAEFWEQNTRKQKFVFLRPYNIKEPWQGTDEQLNELKRRYGWRIEAIDEYVETVKFSAFVNGRCIHKGEDPNRIDEYPFVLEAGFFYPEYDDSAAKLQGIVRPLRDPQKEVSKRISKILDIIDSQVASGIWAEVDALVDPDDIHATGQGKGIWFKDGAISGNKVQEKSIHDIPAGLFQLNHDLQNLCNVIAGVNDSVFGDDEMQKQISGYLLKLRQGAALVSLQDLFDNHRYAKKQLGFKSCKLAQKNYSPDKVFRMINQKPADKFYSEDLARYDLTPTEGLLTETQSQMYYVELLRLRDLGFSIPEEVILEAAPTVFPQRTKDAIIKATEQKRQQEAELLREKQLLDQMRMAKIQADFGRGEERQANVQAHLADASLKRIKMLAELDDMGFNRFMKALEYAKSVEDMNRQTAITRR